MKRFTMIIVLSFIFPYSVFAQNQVPDVFSQGWQFNPVPKIIPVGNGLVVLKTFYNSREDMAVFLTTIVDPSIPKEEELYMLYGHPNDEDPMSAIKVDGKWYKGNKLPTNEEILDGNNNVIGIKISLNTDQEGLKTIEVIYP